MLKKYSIIPILLMLILPSSLLSRIPTTGVRVSNFVQRLVQQDADFLIAQNDIPKTITTAGVYKLSESITVPALTTGITINADDVTLDLNGKKISGSSTGISIEANRNNVTVQNGLIANGTAIGVDVLAGCSNITLQDLQVRNFSNNFLTTSFGMRLTGVTNSTIRRCFVTSTAGIGVSIASNCQRLTIEDSSFNNNVFNGMIMNQCARSIINRCTFANNIQGLLINNGSQNIIINECNAFDNTENGFSLISSNTIFLKQCQSIGNSRSSNSSGFSAQDGYGNIFEECVANSMVTTSTNADEFAAGFLFLGTEQCSKIVNSEAGNITTPVGGNSIPYGIYLQATLDTINTRTSVDHGAQVNSVAWSPDGTYIATGGNSVGTTNQVRVYEYNKILNSIILRATQTNGTSADVKSVAWHPTGSYLAIGGVTVSSISVRVYFFDKTNKTISALAGCNKDHGAGTTVNSVSWSPDGKFLVIGGTNGTGNVDIRVYEFDSVANTLTEVRNTSHGQTVNSVAWSPNGTFFAIGGNFTGVAVRVYEFDPSAKIITQTDTKITTTSVNAVAWSFDTGFLAVGLGGGTDQEVQAFRFDKTAKTLSSSPATINIASNSVNSVSWSPDGKFLAVGCALIIAEFRIYSFTRNVGNGFFGTVPTDIDTNTMFSVAWSPDGTRTAAGGTSGSGISTLITSALKFPSKNTLIGNKTYCITGNQYLTGVGIGGSTIDNLIAQNISYNNDFNYQFATNAFTGGLNATAGTLQNVSIPPF